MATRRDSLRDRLMQIYYCKGKGGTEEATSPSRKLSKEAIIFCVKCERLMVADEITPIHQYKACGLANLAVKVMTTSVCHECIFTWLLQRNGCSHRYYNATVYLQNSKTEQWKELARFMIKDTGKITDPTLVYKNAPPGRENPEQCLTKQVPAGNDVRQKLETIWGQEYAIPDSITDNQTYIL